MDEIEQLRKTIEGYKKKLTEKAETLGLKNYCFKDYTKRVKEVGEGEHLLSIAFGLAIVLRYGFDNNNFLSGIILFIKIKSITGAFTAPQLKLILKENNLDKTYQLSIEEKKLAKEALEIIGET